MSKPARYFCLCLVGIALFPKANFPQNLSVQRIEGETAFFATIRVETPAQNLERKSIAVVFGVFIRQRRNFSLATSVGTSRGLVKRIISLELLDPTGRDIPFRELAEGEYLAETDILSWSCVMDLIAKDGRAAAHASWISDGVGILMARDLLPLPSRVGDVAWVNLKLPHGWWVWPGHTPKPESYGLPMTEGNYVMTQDSVFLIGKGWREHKITETLPLSLAVSGQWHFSDVEAGQMAKEVFDRYTDLFGTDLERQARIAIAKFPVPTSPGEWQAETRGRNVTIISSDMPFKTQSLQRLHEQLRHELFHLWIPNGVNLTGNYDWFYEGFALYQSLKLAVALNRIRFEDFLDTLSRAHTIDSAQSQRTSLIQASAARFSGANTQVYARGMLVAFLSDLALLERSRGKRSVENILEEVFSKHRPPGAEADGNTAVLNILKANAALIPVVEKYVTGAERIEWTADLAAAGIEDADAGPITTLRVKVKPNGRQKAILEHLGYNNWRRLSPSSR